MTRTAGPPSRSSISPPPRDSRPSPSALRKPIFSAWRHSGWSATAAIRIAPPGSLPTSNPASFRGRINLGLSVEERSDGRAISGQLGMPFYSVDGPLRAGRRLHLLRRRRARLRERHPHPVPDAVTPAHARARGRGQGAQGLTQGIRAGRYHRPAGIELVPADPRYRGAHRYHAGCRGCVCQCPPRKLCGRAERAQLRSGEDVAIGPSIRAGVLAAPSAFGYAENGVGLQLTASTGFRFPSASPR